MEGKDSEQKGLIKKARQKLLSQKYGKYDYVEDLLDREYIMQNKPRKIREHISELLKIPIEDLNYNTFLGWLRTYKKRMNEPITKKEKLPDKKNNIENDPFNFNPTDPRTLIKKKNDISSLIKIANRP